MATKLTKAACDRARYVGRTYQGADGKLTASRCVLWDSGSGSVPGFGLRVTPAGERSFVVKYSVNGRARVMALGRYGVLTVQQARDRARKERAKAGAGRDPLEEKREARRAPLVREVAAEFLAEVERRRAANTLKSYRQTLTAYVLPRLGARRLADVKRADVLRLHAALADRPFAANRTVAALGALCSFAKRRGDLESNPVADAVERYREPPRQRYLAAAELARLGGVLAEVESSEGPDVVGAIRFLCLTGCRVTEGLTARWDDVDLATGRWQLQDAKGGPRVVYLPAAAVQLLASLPREAGNPYVFPSPLRPGRPRASLAKPWERIRRRLGWPDLRLHDLRRSHGALAVAGGESLFITSRLLGHKSQAVTDRVYAPLAADPAAAAAERVGGAMAAALSGSKGAAVVKLRRRR